MYHAKSVDLLLMIIVDKSTSQCDPDGAMAYGGYKSHGAVTSSNVQVWHITIRSYDSQGAYQMAKPVEPPVIKVDKFPSLCEAALCELCALAYPKI